nr:RsmF rRNA methyltransferase first C-terminal domain-containing protein [Fonticella tunisiensis]
MKLPHDFTNKMKELLGEEYDEFIKSYDSPRSYGLRINTLKINIDDFLKITPFNLEGIPWAEEGFYYAEDDRPGKHPHHECGLYYIQEPSAMAAGTLLAPQPGERVLDLCAAPGGKSTHIASKLQGQGFLLSNEINQSRARVLSQNIERMGIKNCVVTNESPGRLAQRFKGYFHRILVDAPCSGEGMFRKDETAVKEWSLENVLHCAIRQDEILDSAAEMLMPGGILLYSTCTFSPEENEKTIEKFLKKHSEFSIQEVHPYTGFESGRPEWSDSRNPKLRRSIRLWPHKLRGEGHFIAVLRKTDGEDSPKPKVKRKQVDKQYLKDYYDFANKYLNIVPEGEFIIFGDNLYIVPEEMLSLDGLRVVRPGLHLGTIKKNRFEPSHALALSLKASEAKNNVFLDSSSKETLLYLKGESIKLQCSDGWNLVNVDGYSLGWGKAVSGTLKNHYPKGLRWV